MSEAEALEALTNIGEVTATYSALWLSTTTAYLTISYLVGKSLAKFQCLMISVLYGITAFTFGGIAFGYADSWFALLAREATIFDSIWMFTGMENLLFGAAIVFFGGPLASFYFMYDVRLNKDRPA